MYESPDGYVFEHVAEAAAHALQARPDLATYYAFFAPATYQWLETMKRNHSLDRKTRFDELLWQIARRADYVKIEATNVVKFRRMDRPGS
jgi:hypothetical protein